MALSPDGSLPLVGGTAICTHDVVSAEDGPAGFSAGRRMETPSMIRWSGLQSRWIEDLRVDSFAAEQQRNRRDESGHRRIQRGSGQLLGYVPVPSGTAQTLTFQPYGALAADNRVMWWSQSQLQGGDGIPANLGFLELDASQPSMNLPVSQTQTFGSF